MLFEIVTGEVVLYTVPLSEIPAPPSETIFAPSMAELLVISITVELVNEAAVPSVVVPLVVGAPAVK